MPIRGQIFMYFAALHPGVYVFCEGLCTDFRNALRPRRRRMVLQAFDHCRARGFPEADLGNANLIG